MTDMIVDALVDCFKKGNKLLIAGNGGSAADAQHIAAEFLVRYQRARGPLPAIVLAGDTPTMSAIANDFGYEYVFSRPLKALAQPGDIFLAISTSGNSQSVLTALEVATEEFGITKIGFSGTRANVDFRSACDFWRGFDGDTAAIQEGYMKYAHWMVGEVERCLI